MSRIISVVMCSCVVAAAACTARGKAAPDTTAAQAGEVAASPSSQAPQSLANLAGTWRGRSLPMGRDSVTATWTFVTSGDTGTVALPGGPRVRVYDIHVVGDSIVSKIAAAKSTNPRDSGKIVVSDVSSQVNGDTLTGIVVTRLAAKPDSIVSRGRIIGTRAKP